MVNAIDPSGIDNSRVYESLRPELGQKRGKVDRLQKTEDNYSPFFKSHTTKNTPTPTQCEGIVRNIGQSLCQVDLLIYHLYVVYDLACSLLLVDILAE
jgi:hypothetical protein